MTDLSLPSAPERRARPPRAGRKMAETSAPPGFDLPALTEGLRRVESELTEAVTCEHPFVSHVAAHLQRAGGKRIRPALVILSATFGRGTDQQVVRAAAAVELIHLGSLYHDDVIDEADVRRGVSSVNARWGNVVAILGGDLLLGRASELSSLLGEEASNLLARTLSALVEGEMLELSRAYRLDADIDGYRRVVELKTASLLSASCRVGSLVAGADRAHVDSLTAFGKEMGVAFQLADDVLDLVGDASDLGKPVGTDLSEGLYTHPVLVGLSSRRATELREILADRPGADAVPAVREILESVGALDDALTMARSHLSAARAALAELPAGPVTKALEELGEFLVRRATPAR